MDLAGNLYVTGYWLSSHITFGTITLNNSIVSTGIFIVKYNSSGIVVWATSTSGTNIDASSSISNDALGNLFITGSYQSDTISFGNNINLLNTHTSYTDAFAVKYDTSGIAVWAHSANGTLEEYGNSGAFDINGNLYITGYFDSPTLTVGNNTLISNGGGDFFVIKFDGLGNVIWARNEGGTAPDFARGIALDANGYAYIVGGFVSSTLNLGSTILSNAGNSEDIFIAKLDNTIGIEELNNSSNHVSIYPNPTTHQLNITSTQTIDEVKITDVLGQVVYRAKPKDKNLALQMEREGIYFVTLTSNNQKVTRKLVVQH